MAEFSKSIPAGENISGTFKARLNSGDTITLSVDCAGSLSCAACGIALSADANAEPPVQSVSATATDTGIFEFSYTGYNQTGPGFISASGFQEVFLPLEVSPLSLTFDKTGGTQEISVSGTFEETPTVNVSAPWISESLGDLSSGIYVSENSSIKRAGTVVISAKMTDGTTQTATVNVEQAGEDFKVLPTVWNVGNGGGAKTLSIQPRDVEILVDSSENWASYSNKAIRATANTGDARTATLTVYASAPDSPVRESVSITVNQEAGNGSGGTSGGTGGSDGGTPPPGTATPSGALESGGRVGTVIFRNAAGGTLHYIIRQNP